MQQHPPTPAGGASPASVQLANVVLSCGDRRSNEALLLCTEAQRWRKLGPGRYAIKSRSTNGLVYVVTLHQCTCPDFTRRGEPCKHILAVRLHYAFVAAIAVARVDLSE